MTTTKAEKTRGFKEGFRQIEVLRAAWPKAFPAKSHEVRPLASGAAKTMASTFGWTYAYARAVLMTWKLRDSYCRAVLLYPRRINLDGTESAEEIDDGMRAQAKLRLDRIAARKAQQAAKLLSLNQSHLHDEMLAPSRAPMPVRDVTL